MTQSVFIAGDAVVLPAPFAGRYEVVDFSAEAVVSGHADEPGIVAIGDLPVGWYRVRWSSPESSVEAWESACCVVPSKDPDRPPATELSVNVHTAITDADELPVVTALGVGGLRSSMAWNVVEQDGRYAYPADYERFMAGSSAEGLEPLMIVCYRHADHDGGAGIQSEEAIAAFAGYAADQVERFPQMKSVEVYNEYDWWGTEPTGGPPEDFVRLLAATAGAVRKIRPDIAVVGGSTSAPAGDPSWEWLEEIFRLGALDHLDVIAAHLYAPHAIPEGTTDSAGVTGQLDHLDVLIKEHNGGQSKPIWITETGWGTVMGPTQPAGRPGLAATDDEAAQAAYLVRNAVLAKAWGAEQICWYMFSDVREEVIGESYGWDFGLLRYDKPASAGQATERLVPKPAFVAHAVLADEIGGAAHIERIDSEPGVHHHLFDQGGVEVHVAWATADSRPIEIIATGPVKVTDMMGRTHEVDPQGDVVTVEAGPHPVFVNTGEQR